MWYVLPRYTRPSGARIGIASIDSIVSGSVTRRRPLAPRLAIRSTDGSVASSSVRA